MKINLWTYPYNRGVNVVLSPTVSINLINHPGALIEFCVYRNRRFFSISFRPLPTIRRGILPF